MSAYGRAIREILSKRSLALSVSRVVQILRTEGPTGIRVRLQFIVRRITSAAKQHRRNEVANKLSIVPLYAGSLQDAPPLQDLHGLKIAVHLHLFYRDMLPELASYLDRIPLPFDLFVSVPEGSEPGAVSAQLKQLVRNTAHIEVRETPNRGRDIAPLIVEFGSRLSDYDVIGHFHTKKTPHNDHLRGWRTDLLELLIGAKDDGGSHVARLFGLLKSGAKVVYPEGQNFYIQDKSGWSGNFALASRVLHANTGLSIFDFPQIDFPEGSMLWARAQCLNEFLRLPLTYEDFPQEPIAADGTLAHALERLILVFASLHPGTCVRLHKHDSIRDYRFYEEQQDFRGASRHSNVRVLSYYLPQFHPIPENDRWHGAGFTEWTKVRAANPLFLGHYQQHIPHSDIGYYLLDSAEVLRDQADTMRKAGVHGQVFYHYWFSGKLILERPAQMLLENADIDMPFCFCWANENWTRRWDGNEDDILLKQTYSAEDARAFIRYLIPFFRDARHIRIDGRPILFVYRPTNIPDIGEYLDAWAVECGAAGLPRPFVAAVLTRGALDPNDFGMDAGVERVLHDWTGGKVADIADELVAYRPLDMRVLRYAEVAAHYRQSAERKPFTYFRSLVPNWDNSARYGAAGYLLHDSTPQAFQEWLEEAIGYTEAALPPDRQFVLVNAWNEWAEGAHLEPDSRFGYSYLNAVGRALAGIGYSDTLNPSVPFPASERVVVRLTEGLAQELRSNANGLAAFRACLAGSSIAAQLVAETEIARLLGVSELDSAAAPTDRLALEFRKPVLFDDRMLQKMFETARATKTSVILANAYGQSEHLVPITDNGSTHSFSAYDAPLVLFPSRVGPDGYRNFRVRTDAHCVVSGRQTDANLPRVTTIVRFHRGDDFGLLQQALFCLAAMKGCEVTPLVAVQDLSAEQAAALETLVRKLPWAPGVEPRISHFTSGDGSDLRARMLNQSLQEVKTRYAAFLDFDDRLMPQAYEWLLARLRTTGKAIAIGRVFEALYDPKSEMLTGRSRNYQYGYSYDDFLTVNVAPLHSFMLDLSKLDVAGLAYFEDQRFLEDYFLLLQLVRRDNTDWKGLAQDIYLGDYIRFRDNRNTLAIADPQRGEAVRKSPDYLLCERRIRDLKSSLKR